MKRDFSTIPLNFDGRPFIRPVVKYTAEGVPVSKDGQPEFDKYEKMSLRLFALEALGGRWKGEEGLTIADMSKRIRLYDKICFSTDGLVELDTDEPQIILDCMNKQGRDPIIIARMAAMLEKDPQLASVTPIAPGAAAEGTK